MNVTGLIVEFEPGMGEAVFQGLALLDSVTVYGVRDNKIVVVIEAESVHAIGGHLKEIEKIDYVTGLSPVYSVSE